MKIHKAILQPVDGCIAIGERIAFTDSSRHPIHDEIYRCGLSRHCDESDAETAAGCFRLELRLIRHDEEIKARPIKLHLDGDRNLICYKLGYTTLGEIRFADRRTFEHAEQESDRVWHSIDCQTDSKHRIMKACNFLWWAEDCPCERSYYRESLRRRIRKAINLISTNKMPSDLADHEQRAYDAARDLCERWALHLSAEDEAER